MIPNAKLASLPLANVHDQKIERIIAPFVQQLLLAAKLLIFTWPACADSARIFILSTSSRGSYLFK